MYKNILLFQMKLIKQKFTKIKRPNNLRVIKVKLKEI